MSENDRAHQNDLDTHEMVGGFVRQLDRLRAVRRRQSEVARRAATTQVLIGVAHEVERALADILVDLYGASDLLDHDDGDRAWVEESLRAARRSITQARTLLGDALALAGDEPPSRELVALEPIVARSAQIARRTIQNRACLVTQVGEIGVVDACAAELIQAIVALLTNAAQSFSTADPQRNRIHLTARPFGRLVVIDVSDNGRGVPFGIRDRLFEPYFTTRDDGSLGLGLALASTIVTAHHGSLRLQSSEPGIGTTFRITLPAPDLADTLEHS